MRTRLQGSQLMMFAGWLSGCGAAESHESPQPPTAGDVPQAVFEGQVDSAAVSSDSPPAAFSPTAEQSAALDVVDDNLQRLKDLEVFQVGTLVLDVPDEAYGDYGLPRADWQAVFEAAEATAAVKLATLAEQSEQAVDAMYRGGALNTEEACADGMIDENLTALRALRVVGVGELLVEEPQAADNCYGLPCSGEVERARDVTCDRAARLDHIADRVSQ